MTGLLRTTATLAFMLSAATLGHAQEVTLRAITAFQEGTSFSLNFERFVEKVNAEGAGIMQIQLIGGPGALPPFEVGNALRSGVVDLANTTGVFHTNLVPEGTALTLVEVPMTELRRNGGYEYINRLHEEKGNMRYLGRVTEGIQYHIYSKTPMPEGKVEGLQLRSVPVYQSFFSALGATPIQMPAGEVFTGLERGVVDGYGWPSVGIFDLGWQEQTAYRLEPGFFNVEVGLFMNLDAWNRLTEEQKTFLEAQVAWLEGEAQTYAALAETEKQRQAEAGIETVELSAEAAAAFLDQAREAGWEGIERVSPEHAPKLRELFTAQ